MQGTKEWRNILRGMRLGVSHFSATQRPVWSEKGNTGKIRPGNRIRKLHTFAFLESLRYPQLEV
jgi:hypothetical protein